MFVLSLSIVQVMAVGLRPCLRYRARGWVCTEYMHEYLNDLLINKMKYYTIV